MSYVFFLEPSNGHGDDCGFKINDKNHDHITKTGACNPEFVITCCLS